jgi:hypothetical protein
MVCLNGFFIGDDESSIALTAASIQRLRATPMSWSLHRVRKVNTLACRFNSCSSVSIFGTQHEHNFRKQSFSDTIA